MPRKFVPVTVLAILICTSVAAQTPLRAPMIAGHNNMWAGGAYGFGGARLPSDTFGLMRMPQIIKELNLYDDQIASIGKLQEEMHEKTREVFKDRNFAIGDVAKIMQEAQRAIREQTVEKLEEILLPQQLKRIKEIKAQALLRSQGSRAILGDDFSDVIKLTEEQKTNLLKEQGEAQKELQKEIAALREKYQRQVVEKVLTKSQLNKLDGILGEEYEVQAPDYRAMYTRPTPSKPAEKKSK